VSVSEKKERVEGEIWGFLAFVKSIREYGFEQGGEGGGLGIVGFSSKMW